MIEEIKLVLRWGGMGSDGRTVAYPEICNIEIGIGKKTVLITK